MARQLRRAAAGVSLAVCGSGLLTLGASPAGAQQTAAAASGGVATSITLEMVMRQALEASPQLRSAAYQRDLAATGIPRAEAAFQPQFTHTLTNGVNAQANTYEESLIRRDAGFYERKGTDASMAVTQQLSSGIKLEGKLTLSRFDTNINRLQPSRPPDALDFRSQWQTTVTFPLWRDAGTRVNRAPLEAARLDMRAADENRARTETTVLAEVISAYHELSFAGRRLQLAQSRIAMAEKLLSEARALFAQGRLAESEVWAVETALSRFRADLLAARQFEREKGNRLKSMLMVSSQKQPEAWRAADALPEVRATAPQDPDQIRSDALRNRSDLKKAQLQHEREGMLLTHALNKARPKVDLLTSYGRNDLALALRPSLAQMPFQTWYVGLQVELPIGSNLAGTAEVSAARVRQQDADLRRQALEVEIANEVDTALALRSSALERHAQWVEITNRERRALDLERSRLQNGRSGMREVLRQEERLVDAELGLLEQQLQVAQAGILVESAQGVLGRTSR